MLPEIDFSISNQDFNLSAFDAMQKNGGFILNLGPKFSHTVEKMFSAYDDFRDQELIEKMKFKGDSKELNGYFHEGIIYGNKAGPRFFIKRDADGEIRHPLPFPRCVQIGIREADDELFFYAKQIIAKTICSLDFGFNLKNTFVNQFYGHVIRTSVHHYLPVTQEKLRQWIKFKNLTKTADGRIEAFAGHKDLVPLTILIYRNNEPNGLELEIPDASGNKIYQLVKFNDDANDIKAIVIAGRAMENLTDNLLSGVAHRVIAKPLFKNGQIFNRDGINIFFFLNPEKELKPLIVSSNGPHFSPISTEQFYTDWSNIYEKEAQERFVGDLAEEELNCYPKESEIAIEKTSQGVFYRRMSSL